MAYLRNVNSGAVTFDIPSDHEAYQNLVRILDGGGRPVWEDVPEEDVVAATVRVAVAVVPALGAAANDTVELDGGESIPEGAAITAAEYWPGSPIVGADTDTRTILIKDGATTKATRTMIASDGTLGVAGASAPFTINSAAVVAGDPLVVTSTHAGAGLPDPGGVVTAELTLTA